MTLVSGSDWLQKVKYEEETGNPYEEPYPATKWDSTNPVVSSIEECPKCDCTATVQTMNAVLSALQKFSDYQEETLGEIIAQLKARIAAEGGGEAKATRSSAVGGVAALYGTEKALAEFWKGLDQIERMFITRSPQPSDISMLQSQIQSMDRFSALYTLDPSTVSAWREKLNKWISMASKGGAKDSVYFSTDTSGFGSGGA